MGQEGNAQRFCRKCLLSDIAEEDFLKNMRIYIEGLDPDIKVCPEVYQERLILCRECDSLISGMCRVCGCFVEYRAAVKKNHCPGIERKW